MDRMGGGLKRRWARRAHETALASVRRTPRPNPLRGSTTEEPRPRGSRYGSADALYACDMIPEVELIVATAAAATDTCKP